MADRPEVGGVPNYYPWATSSIIQTINVGGEVLLIPNKNIPLDEHTNFGLRYQEWPNYPELNYQLAGYSNWFEFFDGQLQIGDIKKTTSSETEAQISTRMGGTWVSVGTEIIGAETVNVFKKTA